MDQEACLLSTSCNISESHTSLCTSIINALSALQVGLNSNDEGLSTDISPSATESEGGSEKRRVEVDDLERVKSPPVIVSTEVRSSHDFAARRPEALPNEHSFLKRKEGKPPLALRSTDHSLSQSTKLKSSKSFNKKFKIGKRNTKS